MEGLFLDFVWAPTPKKIQAKVKETRFQALVRRSNLLLLNSGLHSGRGYTVDRLEEAVAHFRRELRAALEVSCNL